MMSGSTWKAGIARLGIVGGTLLFFGAALGGTGHAASPEVTREIARLRILDSCVYSQWKDESKRETAAKVCGCAAGKVVKSMTDEEFAAYVKAGKLTSVHKEKWDAAMDSCD